MINCRPPVPIFRSFNEAATRAFYIDFLGFEVMFEHRFNPDAPLYMGVRLGQCRLHLSEHYGDAAPGASVRIEVDDVAAYCAALNERKYRHARPGYLDQEWGSRDMMIDDPSGNRMIFFTELE